MSITLVMKAAANLLDPPPGTPGGESTATLLRHPSFTLEHIVSRGASSPGEFWYDQDQDEWVLLLSGEAVIQYDSGETVSMKAGDPLLIPAHRRHRVARTSADAVWLALFHRASPCSPSGETRR